MAPQPIAGLLLTGGASKRMGVDKASLPLVGGGTPASRVAAALAVHTSPTMQVGRRAVQLPWVPDRWPGQGPLAAVASGLEALGAVGYRGPVLVVACDLPLLTPAVVALVANWPGDSTVVPVVDGRAQPLCARYGSEALAAVPELMAAGARSMRALLDATTAVEWLGDERWEVVAEAAAFADVDRPEDLRRLGLEVAGS
jgi:molybdopterin-guanine dinucleotide biosynthesis protein A